MEDRKLRVLHVITRMIVGGAQENTLLNCLDLRRIHGDDVMLVTGPSLGPEGDLLGEARAGDLPVARVPDLRRAIDPFHDLRALRRIAAVIRAYQPDVVHTHSAKGGILGRQAAWSLGVPAVVHTVHGAPFHPYQRAAVRAFFRACERRAARQCHRLISVADAMTDLLVDAGVAPREKFVTIYSGMEVAPFLEAGTQRRAVRARLGLEDHHVVVGKIARLFHLKGHADLVRAAREVVARQPDVRFLLVGDGILRAALERQIAEAGLAPHFVMTGLVPPETIPGYVGAMDLLVHTSLREGLARALPQALIAGRPVISYDIDGAREVVRDGETGFLVAPGDVAGLADRIGRLAADAELRERFGERGRGELTDLFRHESMTGRIRRLYCEILGGEAPPPEQAAVGGSPADRR